MRDYNLQPYRSPQSFEFSIIFSFSNILYLKEREESSRTILKKKLDSGLRQAQFNVDNSRVLTDQEVDTSTWNHLSDIGFVGNSRSPWRRRFNVTNPRGPRSALRQELWSLKHLVAFWLYSKALLALHPSNHEESCRESRMISNLTSKYVYFTVIAAHESLCLFFLMNTHLSEPLGRPYQTQEKYFEVSVASWTRKDISV